MDVNLVLVKKDGSQKNFPLQGGVTVIGRRHDCDLRIAVMSVSRKHCQLSCGDGALKIRDLGSRNGTILNGEPVDEAVVQAGDSIEVGPLKFICQIDGKPEDIAKGPPEAEELPQEDVLIEDLGEQDTGAIAEQSDLLEDDLELSEDDSDLLGDDLELLEDDSDLLGDDA